MNHRIVLESERNELSHPIAKTGLVFRAYTAKKMYIKKILSLFSPVLHDSSNQPSTR